ncbi:hypothetical protein [Streptomyces sp. NPDC014995]|uniref:hypothetical protein n=1 Tax=Streptomyces sp. NPDC014995 TaxID=3364936 RepID=UPI0037017DAF
MLDGPVRRSLVGGLPVVVAQDAQQSLLRGRRAGRVRSPGRPLTLLGARPPQGDGSGDGAGPGPVTTVTTVTPVTPVTTVTTVTPVTPVR